MMVTASQVDATLGVFCSVGAGGGCRPQLEQLRFCLAFGMLTLAFTEVVGFFVLPAWGTTPKLPPPLMAAAEAAAAVPAVGATA